MDDGVDPAAIEQLAALGDDVVHELVDVYLAEADDRVARMTEAAARGDIPAVRLEAHSLRSGALQYGAVALGHLCETVERAAAEGSLDVEILALVPAEHARSSAALRALMGR